MPVFLKVLLLISDAQNLPITFNNRFCCLGETRVLCLKTGALFLSQHSMREIMSISDGKQKRKSPGLLQLFTGSTPVMSGGRCCWIVWKLGPTGREWYWMTGRTGWFGRLKNFLVSKCLAVAGLAIFFGVFSSLVVKMHFYSTESDCVHEGFVIYTAGDYPSSVCNPSALANKPVFQYIYITSTCVLKYIRCAF